ncbi:MAG: type II toxin-antitoxin system HicA family toxin [bacterium]
MALSELPKCSGLQTANTLVRFGWVIRKKGTHIVLTKEGSRIHLSIPNHRQVDRALLHEQLKKAGIKDKDFKEMFDKF